jgi:hypothetical protein
MARGVWLGLLVALVPAAPARAGTYQVNACTAGAKNAAWAPFNSSAAAFEVIAGCPFTARSQAAPNRRAGYFEAGWWRLNAPPGTVVDRLRITRDGYRFSQGDGEVVGGVPQGGWVSEAYTEDGRISYGFGTEGCTIPQGVIYCAWGDKNTPIDLDLDAQQVTYQVACIVSTGCDTSNNAGTPFAAVTIYNAVATIRDDVAPALTIGGPLLSGGWQRPNEPIAVDATDVTGISSATGPGGSAPTPCNYSNVVPCANLHGSLVPNGLADGTQPITVTVKDAAGNPTSVTRTVSIDGTPPTVRLRKPNGRTLVVSVGDELSGVSSGQIAAGGTPLPTTLRNGRLTTRLPHGKPRVPPISVTVTDNAGNSASGIPPRLSLPARRHVRFGHRFTIHGRVTTPSGAAVANAAVQAFSTVRRHGAKAVPAGGTRTGRSGRFNLRLPAGPSRTIRIVVPPAGTVLRAARGVSVRVPATSTIHASRHVVGAGERVRFSGRIKRGGQRLPPHGLVVILQGRSAGAWRTFADTRTTAEGRWHASYRFHGIPGRYPVRLRIRRATGFPFDLGYSPTTTVRVR